MDFIIFILKVLAINALATFILAAFVRSKWLCVLMSVIVTESLLALPGLLAAAHSNDVDDILLAVNITGMMTTPVIVGTSIGFGVLARRLYKKSSSSPGV